MPLTDKQIKALKPEEKPKRYFDGGGMYLEIAPNGSKKWRLKYRIGGVEKCISLGVYPEVSLLEAREKLHEHKKMLRDGQDPSVERRRSKARARSFEDIGREWLAKEQVMDPPPSRSNAFPSGTSHFSPYRQTAHRQSGAARHTDLVPGNPAFRVNIHGASRPWHLRKNIPLWRGLRLCFFRSLPRPERRTPLLQAQTNGRAGGIQRHSSLAESHRRL